MSEDRFERCYDLRRKTCFGIRTYMMCGVLTNTYAIGKECPFYKTKEEFEKHFYLRPERGT